MDNKIDFSSLEKEIDMFKSNFSGVDIDSNHLLFVSSIVIPYFEQLIRLVRPADFTELQLEQLNNIVKRTSDYINQCNTLFISNKNKDNLNFNPIIDMELSDLVSLYNEYRSVLDGFLSLAIGNSVAANQNRLDWEMQKIKNSINDYETKTTEAIDNLKILAEDITIPKYANVYSDAKKEYDKIANKWLGVGVVLSVLLVVSIILVLYCVPIPTYQSNDNPFVYIITNFSLRFTLIGIFLYLLYFVGHKYNVAKHNATLYGSKSAALKSFLAFIQTTSDNEVKNTMLIAITNFIFKGNNTGYLGSDKVVDDLDPNNVMNVLSDLIHKTK
ncbi:DUF6161 domain-containing protein [Veillonella sp.]|uniref:DUF6161 domain-containing protein n=1 Tax=Veillonella sp. TaxID=1926307 RepID=UPI0025D137EA|nr:DUF6161 domain-containing protein [Veillonella sp.]